jgi:hypothetical protein
MDTEDVESSIKNLIDIWTTIGTAAGEYLDPSTTPLDLCGDAHRIQQWNTIYAGASDMLLAVLIPAVDDESESLIRYINSSFNKAQALKQLVG